MSEHRTYRGQINFRDDGDYDDALYLGDADYPLVMTLKDDRREHGPYATVRYFTSEQEKIADQLDEALTRMLVGEVDAEYDTHYSEITGYLWTDENLRVGGHDLLAELRSLPSGWWLYMEIIWMSGKPGEVPS